MGRRRCWSSSDDCRQETGVLHCKSEAEVEVCGGYRCEAKSSFRGVLEVRTGMRQKYERHLELVRNGRVVFRKRRREERSFLMLVGRQRLVSVLSQTPFAIDNQQSAKRYSCLYCRRFRTQRMSRCNDNDG